MFSKSRSPSPDADDGEIETEVSKTKLSLIAPAEEPRLYERIGVALRRELDKRDELLTALLYRIEQLEKRDWNGVWTEGKSYGKGAIISHDGSAWTATKDYPQGKPGTPNSGWKLFVKRGRDGK